MTGIFVINIFAVEKLFAAFIFVLNILAIGIALTYIYRDISFQSNKDAAFYLIVQIRSLFVSDKVPYLSKYNRK